MTTLVLAFIGTYYIELLYRRIILGKRWEVELNIFNNNLKTIDFIEQEADFKLAQSHLYK
ncbi:hypothetical protein L3X37_13815 [Sabulilitoribacter arenilitoris]|uniref:Uncharacterized protein n=1 Tax=Wocania arenilitoris TaxID=2044858 RepID=A0AAE3EQZ3_9FLAO|nr:hypothetical protein [Wocania arenilitoris]MCF7569426.1 hypothetical protein [Wocania arenilitoris]